MKLDFYNFGNEKLLVDFVNENDIKRDDILTIKYDPINGGITLFYYVEE